jgi:WD40 repeat protein
MAVLACGLLAAGPGRAADPTRTIPNAHPGAKALMFSPDATRMASFDWGKNPTLNLWDTATGKLIGTLTGRLPCLEEILFSPDGKLLAATWSTRDPEKRIGGISPKESEIIVCSADTGERRYTLTGKFGGVYGPEFSPDGKVILAKWWESDPKQEFVHPPRASEKVLYAAETGKPIATIPCPMDNYGPRFTFLRDGRLVAVPYASYEATKEPIATLDADAYDPATGRKLDPVRIVFPAPTVVSRRSLFPFPDRNWVAVVTKADRGAVVRFFEIKGNEGRPVPGGEFPVSVAEVASMDFSADGRRVLGRTALVAVPFFIADLGPDGRVTRTREPFNNTEDGVGLWTRDGRFAAAGPGLIDLDTGKNVVKIDPPAGTVGGTFSRDGRWAAAIDDKGTIRLWDISRATAPKP